VTARMNNANRNCERAGRMRGEMSALVKRDRAGEVSRRLIFPPSPRTRSPITSWTPSHDRGDDLAAGRKESGMDHFTSKLSLNLGQLDNRHVRLILVILSLILFILGAGAPGTGSGVGG
jgi:hypothetical protein